MGEGAKEFVARRRVAMAKEKRMRKEGEAFFAAHIRGRGSWPDSALTPGTLTIFIQYYIFSVLLM